MLIFNTAVLVTLQFGTPIPRSLSKHQQKHCVKLWHNRLGIHGIIVVSKLLESICFTFVKWNPFFNLSKFNLMAAEQNHNFMHETEKQEREHLNHDHKAGANENKHTGPGEEKSTTSRKDKRGFASMDAQMQRQIASKGGRAAHAQGVAHEFNSAEAREAGRKGGVAVSRNRQHMAEIGKKGGEAAHNKRKKDNTNSSV